MISKQKLSISILMMAVGIVIFLWILIRFFNQGYFGGEPRVFYNFPFEMKDWFGTMVYSFLFAISGYYLLNKESNTLIVCQFVVVGVIIDRIWYIAERVNNVDVLQSFIPMLLALFAMFYLISNQNGYKEYLKKIILFISFNAVILSIGKFMLPNM